MPKPKKKKDEAKVDEDATEETPDLASTGADKGTVEVKDEDTATVSKEAKAADKAVDDVAKTASAKTSAQPTHDQGLKNGTQDEKDSAKKARDKYDWPTQASNVVEHLK